MKKGSRLSSSRKFDASTLMLVLLVAFTFRAHAAVNEDSLLTIHPDSLRSKNYLSLGVSYGNNSSFLGRYQSRSLPFLGIDATFLHRSGLWVSAMGYDITGTNDLPDEVDLMVGYNVNISSRWDASISYGRYFFNENTELVKSSVANAASASVGFDWSILYSKAGATYIFGNDVSDVFLILDNSRYFELGEFLGGDISIDPQVGIIAGTQTFFKQYLVTEEIKVKKGKPSNPGNGKGNGGNNGNGNGNGNGNSNGNGNNGNGNNGNGNSGPETILETTVIESESRAFKIMSYEISLPVTYSRGRWTFETNGRYTIPANTLAGYLSKPQFFLTSSLYYTINSKR